MAVGAGSLDVADRTSFVVRRRVGVNGPASSTGDRVQLDGLSVRYQVHVQGHGWMDRVDEGELAGTTGRSRRLEAIRVELVRE